MIHTPCREPNGAFAGVSTPVGRPGRDRAGHPAAPIFPPPGRGLHGSSLTILSPATSTRSSATLVELESELEDLLVDYEAVTGAWPKEPHILTRAKAGCQVEDLLGRIYETQRAIATSQAKTLSCASEDQEGCGMSAYGYERTSSAGLLNDRCWP